MSMAIPVLPALLVLPARPVLAVTMDQMEQLVPQVYKALLVYKALPAKQELTEPMVLPDLLVLLAPRAQLA